MFYVCSEDGIKKEFETFDDADFYIDNNGDDDMWITSDADDDWRYDGESDRDRILNTFDENF